MGYKYVYAARDVKQTPVVQAVYAILHKHRHTIKLQTINDYGRTAKIMNVRRQTFNGVSTIHTVVMITCDEYLMAVWQIAKPIHEIIRLGLRACESKVARMYNDVGFWQIMQFAVPAMCVRNMKYPH